MSKRPLTTSQFQETLTGIRLMLDAREYVGALQGIEEAVNSSDLSLSPSELAHLTAIAGECLALVGRSDEAVETASRIVAEYQESDNHLVFGSACIGVAAGCYFIGDLERAQLHAEIAYHAFLRGGDRAGTAKSLNWSGNISFYMGDYESATRSYRKCIAFAEEYNLDHWTAVASLNLGLTDCLVGRLQEALSSLVLCAERSSKSNDRLTSLRSRLVVSYAKVLGRDFEQARIELSTVRTESLLDTYPREQSSWHEYMGELELCCNNLPEAEQHLTRAIEIGSCESRDESVIGQSRRLLAEVRLAQGNLDETVSEAERALESIRKVGERFEEGVVYRVIGEVHVRRNEPSEARAAFKQSLDILRDIGARLEWAKSCLAAGETDIFSRRERLAYLAEAERLFTDIGVEYWSERTREQLKIVLDDRGEELTVRRGAPVRGSLFITADPATLELLQMAERYAKKDIAILLTGETGVGKDQLARHLHTVSPRHHKPFVAIDLNTIPESLWESELFGHRKGTFTGASAEKIGLLESADGGTVFLNEIGNLPLALQSKILEFLDTHHIRRLGEVTPTPLDIRLIAATNLKLVDAVAKGQFRADLYYRLAQAPLALKPLRERRVDIMPLIRHFMVEYGVPPAEVGLIDRQLWVDRASNGHWAGNVRDLRSFVYRLIAIADRPSDPEFPRWAMLLVEQIDVIHEPNIGSSVTPTALSESLDRHAGNQRAAARELGVSETTIRRLMNRFGLARPAQTQN